MYAAQHKCMRMRETNRPVALSSCFYSPYLGGVRIIRSRTKRAATFTPILPMTTLKPSIIDYKLIICNILINYKRTSIKP